MNKTEDAVPLYQKLHRTLRRQIEQGRYKPDQPIPSERSLCLEHGISRITVRQAIAEMIQEGLLYRQPGKGTFVARRQIHQGLARITSFSRTVLDIGLKPATLILSQGLIPLDLALASVLNLDPAGQAFRLILLGLGDDQPLVVYESYFSPSLGQRLLEEALAREEKGLPFSSYDLYGEAAGLFPSKVNQTYEAVAADEERAVTLRVAPGEALLKVTSIFTTKDGSPLEFRQAYYRGDYYKFQIIRELA